jgi:multicomponent Na+:H+ antiporter subunit D
MLGWLKRTLTITLDIDWLYRWLGPMLARRVDRAATAAWNRCVAMTMRGVRRAPEGIQTYLGPEGILARTWPTGAMAFWMTIMLAVYLVLSYL